MQRLHEGMMMTPYQTSQLHRECTSRGQGIEILLFGKENNWPSFQPFLLNYRLWTWFFFLTEFIPTHSRVRRVFFFKSIFFTFVARKTKRIICTDCYTPVFISHLVSCINYVVFSYRLHCVHIESIKIPLGTLTQTVLSSNKGPIGVAWHLSLGRADWSIINSILGHVPRFNTQVKEKNQEHYLYYFFFIILILQSVKLKSIFVVEYNLFDKNLISQWGPWSSAPPNSAYEIAVIHFH